MFRGKIPYLSNSLYSFFNLLVKWSNGDRLSSPARIELIFLLSGVTKILFLPNFFALRA